MPAKVQIRMLAGMISRTLRLKACTTVARLIAKLSKLGLCLLIHIRILLRLR